mmetsp:Transcript_13363/g.34137  ORF Transcript_13363/g.34137 Transcript_13363/m.34137 type:complete len:387 (+) Transcript_13363:41-1201(+)
MYHPVRRLVPHDHSCLFECFKVLCGDRKKWEPATASGLRALCADAAEADPDPATKSLMLGMSVDAYAGWIKNEMNWGGEQEIITLADYFGVEVAVVSCESFNLLVYGQGDGKERIHLLYTGQHYDPIVSQAEGADEADVEHDAPVLSAAATASPEYEAALVAIAKTHVAEFERKMKERRVKRIKCLGCGAILNDNLAFQEHCMTVEHDEDFAYDCEEVEIVESGDDAVPDDRLDLAADSTLTFYNLPDVWFSPLYPTPITIDGVTFPTTEHHFQYHRFHGQDPDFATVLLGVPRAEELPPLVDAQDYVKQHPEWDTVKADVLKAGIEAKAAQHPEIAAQLKATDDKTLVLIDRDPWAGVQAGDGIPTGRNAAGEAWMAVRATLGSA